MTDQCHMSLPVPRLVVKSLARITVTEPSARLSGFFCESDCKSRDKRRLMTVDREYTALCGLEKNCSPSRNITSASEGLAKPHLEMISYTTPR
jgi:hypothetical protein